MSTQRADLGPAAAGPSATDLAQLQLLFGGFRLSVAIYVIAELGIVDFLVEGSQPTDVLATATRTDVDALYRLLRLVAGAKLLMEVAPRRFALTALGSGLRRDLAETMRPQVLNMLGPPRWAAWGELLHSIRTNEPAFDRALGIGLFEYLRRNPDIGQRFNAAMTSQTERSASAIVKACDFNGVERLVDVGGGHGLLLAAILRAHPRMQGVLFDAPEVVAGAGPLLSQAGVAQRCEVVGGDFFEAVPDGDTYILRHVLHNWEDSRATSILANCRRALVGDGRVLVVERAIGTDYPEQLGTLLLDVQMLIMLGGRERTIAEYRKLFSEALLSLGQARPVRDALDYFVFEGVPV
jgi:hypothetical protein